MTNLLPQHIRVMAIAPSAKGFGYAVMDGLRAFVDWGTKTTSGDKNEDALRKTKEMIALHKPAVLILEDVFAKESRRAPRVRILVKRISKLGAKLDTGVALVSKTSVKGVLLGAPTGTKHAVAEKLALRFSEELGYRLPRKRRPWTSEYRSMQIFEAVALAVAYLHLQTIPEDQPEAKASLRQP